MTMQNTTTRQNEDIKRRAFSPIQMDLVERLTRQADTLAGHLPYTASDRSSDTNKLAA